MAALLFALTACGAPEGKGEAFPRRVVLEAGEGQQYAPPSEILNGPATPFVEELVCRSRQFQARA